MKMLNVLKKVVIIGCVSIMVIGLSVVTCKESYALVFENSNNKVIDTIPEQQLNKPHWQRVADNPENQKVMFYKVDLNNDCKILETLSYSKCINRDDSNAWYCPVDCYQEELDHINKVKNCKDNSKDCKVVPATPYVSNVSKIVKSDYK